MWGLRALVGRSLRRAAGTFVAVAGVVCAFQVILVLVAVSFEQTRSFDLLTTLMPLVVQRSLGPGVLMLASFTGIVTFGYYHPVVVLTFNLCAAYLATEPAGELEWKLFDVELARPVARRTIVTRSLVVSIGVAIGLAALMTSATWLALWAFAPPGATWPRPAVIGSFVAHLVMLGCVFATAGLFAATLARRRGTAFAAVAVAGVSLYLLNVVGDVWQPATRARWLSPFHYFPGLAIAGGTASTGVDLAMLAVPAVLLTAAAYWRFARRDL